MLPRSLTAVVARNERWSGRSSTEPYEVGWAREAIIFVRTLADATGDLPEASVEISADGIRWTAEGTVIRLPTAEDQVAYAKVGHFGNWLRLSADIPEGSNVTVLVSIHLKA
jgi:hypothetical protein